MARAAPTGPERPLTPEEWELLFQHVDAAVKDRPDHPLLVGKPEGNPVQTRPPWDPNPDKWANGVQTLGGARWAAGIKTPRQDFKSAALAANDAWKGAVTAAVQADRFAKGMAGVDVDYALSIAEQVGATGYTNGALARKTKFQRNTDAIKARMASVVQRVRGMPNATLQQRIARVTETINGFAAVGKGTATA